MDWIVHCTNVSDNQMDLNITLGQCHAPETVVCYNFFAVWSFKPFRNMLTFSVVVMWVLFTVYSILLWVSDPVF